MAEGCLVRTTTLKALYVYEGSSDLVVLQVPIADLPGDWSYQLNT